MKIYGITKPLVTPKTDDILLAWCELNTGNPITYIGAYNEDDLAKKLRMYWGVTSFKVVKEI